MLGTSLGNRECLKLEARDMNRNVDVEQQPHRGHRAVGAWRQTVTVVPDQPEPNQPVFGFGSTIAFTSDGIVDQAVSVVPDAAVGVWEPNGENAFRSTLLLFRHDSAGLEGSSTVRAD